MKTMITHYALFIVLKITKKAICSFAGNTRVLLIFKDKIITRLTNRALRRSKILITI